MILRYRRLDITVCSDTMFSKYQSLQGNKCAQVFYSDGLVLVYPLKSKSLAGEALQRFLEDIGIPSNEIIVDGAQEQVGQNSDFMKLIQKSLIKLRTTEPYTPRQNKVELCILVIFADVSAILCLWIVFPHVCGILV